MYSLEDKQMVIQKVNIFPQPINTSTSPSLFQYSSNPFNSILGPEQWDFEDLLGRGSASLLWTASLLQC